MSTQFTAFHSVECLFPAGWRDADKMHSSAYILESFIVLSFEVWQMPGSCCKAFPPQQLVQLWARAEPEPCPELFPLCPSPAVPLQLRNFRCGEVEFVSRVGPRPSLLCLKVEEVGQDALGYLNSQRMSRTSSSC